MPAVKAQKSQELEGIVKPQSERASLLERIGQSLKDVTDWMGRGRGLVLRTTIPLALIGVMALGSAGCSKNAENPDAVNRAAAAAKQDPGTRARIELKKQEAKRMAERHNQMEQQGVGVGQKGIDFGGTIIPESKEPTWHRMIRLDAAGVESHSQDEIKNAAMARAMEMRQSRNTAQPGEDELRIMKAEANMLMKILGQEKMQEIKDSVR
jgi:hypothetical protein